MDADGGRPWVIGRASQWWLHGSLAALDADLRARGSRLIIRGGASAAELLGQLVRDTAARYVTWERGLTPAERAREAAVGLCSAPWASTTPHSTARLLVDPSAIERASPFHVYSAYWRAVRALVRAARPTPAPRRLLSPSIWPASESLDSLGLLPRPDWAAGLRATWQPGEALPRSRPCEHSSTVRLADTPTSATCQAQTARRDCRPTCTSVS